ncbi:MAG: peptide-methionine (S)-S-oxide reductase MsrA [Flavobacterium sp.]|nr:peptide-methionine (S)-S-oxide reductase MsrA [Flavobacterium sp.]
MKQLKRSIAFVALGLVMLGQNSCAKAQGVYKVNLAAPKGKAIAAFAEGCFWCSPHIFDAVPGIDSAVAGYAGGHTVNPTYRDVCTETTGHAETILVYYDPKVISYNALLDVFFTSHDPTTKDQQGPDRGSSYRSVIFYQTPAEKVMAANAIAQYNKLGMFKKPIVTEVTPLTAFYRAEEYHQKFVQKNPDNGYIQNVSLPRFERFKNTYKGRLKN